MAVAVAVAGQVGFFSRSRVFSLMELDFSNFGRGAIGPPSPQKACALLDARVGVTSAVQARRSPSPRWRALALAEGLLTTHRSVSGTM